MNLLEDIFFEYFNQYYYQNILGRSYCEYIIKEGKKYKGEICFFHFSLDKSRKLNSFFAAKILFFIKLFYSHAFNDLYIITKYCINNNIVISLNSLSEYKFVIKFWNENIKIRKLLHYIIVKSIGKKQFFEINSNANFFELIVNTEKQKFEIQEFRNYVEIDKEENIINYIEGYLEKDNIFMVFNIEVYNFISNKKYSKLLFKLNNPIKFNNSRYLMDNYYNKGLKKYFKSEEIYLGFIEKGNNGDLLYFTNFYSIKA